MPATITNVVDPDTAEGPIFLVTRRELVVLTASVAVVCGAILLLVLTSSQVAAALFGQV